MNFSRSARKRIREMEEFVAFIAARADAPAPKRATAASAPVSAEVWNNPDDDAGLALAVVAQADVIVPGDADLLVRGVDTDVQIVTPAQALTAAGGAGQA